MRRRQICSLLGHANEKFFRTFVEVQFDETIGITASYRLNPIAKVFRFDWLDHFGKVVLPRSIRGPIVFGSQG